MKYRYKNHIEEAVERIHSEETSRQDARREAKAIRRASLEASKSNKKKKSRSDDDKKANFILMLKDAVARRAARLLGG